MIYFAYGSNLDRAQMQARCPESRFIVSARLDGHRLCFPRRSFIRNCATASIEPHVGSYVWGALYELTEEDFVRLDAREGYVAERHPAENNYNRAPILVRRPDGERVEAVTYVANPTPAPGPPSTEYLTLIINGAVFCRLPEDYIAMLRTFSTEPAA
jgi:gamma-glutamylcyclotransferase (GGCT)/AIG2-like uncharacterized protein YtfP